MPALITVQRNLNFINVKDYGAVGDGVTDDTTAIASAYPAVKNAGGGILFFPPGTFLSGNIPLANGDKVYFVGCGIGVSTLKLKSGANTDLISAYTSNINIGIGFGTGSSTGITTPWGISNLTLDGNRYNQTGGPSYPLRYYGYGEIFQNIEVKNGYSGGILRDWNAPTPNAPTGSWDNIFISFNHGPGLVIGGPTDLKFNRIFPNNNEGHNWYLGPNAGALNATNCHSWAPNNTSGVVLSLLCEASQCLFENCEFEGSNTVQVALLANEITFKGWVFAGTATGAGIQIGQLAGGTPYPGQILQSGGLTVDLYITGCIIDVTVTDIVSANGSLWLVADKGNNIRANITQSSGVYLAGYPGKNTTFLMQGNGLTATGAIGNGSSQRFFSDAYQGFIIGRSNDGQIWAEADTHDGTFNFSNGCSVAGYSDGFSTTQWTINGITGDIATNGNIATGQSATQVVLASSGTINTANVGVACVAPTGNITDVILQAGTIKGQRVTVWNNSAFTIAFATAATSNVADGTLAVIAANRTMDFTWNSVAARWGHS